MTRDDLRAALSHPNVAAFLRVIRAGESSQDDAAYRLQNGGKVFPEYQVEHPSKGMRSPPGRAFGAYQFLASTWAGLVKKYGFTAMTPDQQDEGAIALIVERGALDEIERGDFDRACFLLEDCWTSLPGGAEQNAATARARETYLRWGGQLAPAPSETIRPQPEPTHAPGPDPGAFDPDTLATEHYDGREPYQYTPPVTPPAPKKETTMAVPLIPIFTALLPTITQLIPALAQVFKPGSEVAQRNVAAATIVSKAITEATQSPNLQAAIERMQEDPEAVRRATAAVTAPDVWGQLVEPGPGVEAARKAAASPDQVPPWKNPAVWFMASFIPLVYGTAYVVLTGDFSNDAKMMVVTAIFSGLLASGTAFFLGSSLGSQRKTTMLSGKE